MFGDFQVVGVHRDRQFSLCAPLFLLADSLRVRCRHPAAAALSTGLAAAHAYPQAEMQRRWSCRPTTARRHTHLAQGVYDGRARAPYGLGLLMLLLLSEASGCTLATSGLLSSQQISLTQARVRKCSSHTHLFITTPHSLHRSHPRVG
eukprot:COSAG06_NODE_8251_length_2223_cov_5.241996_2_plen_148_part_00